MGVPHSVVEMVALEGVDRLAAAKATYEAELAALRAELAKFRECVKNPGSAMEWIAVMQDENERLARVANLVKGDLHWHHIDDTREIERLRAQVIDLHAQLSTLESREVCTAPHDGDVETCGYCQRDALQARVAELEDAIARALPGVIYMDPPDGGSVGLPEQLLRMAADAKRVAEAERLLRQWNDHYCGTHNNAESIDDDTLAWLAGISPSAPVVQK